MVLLLDEHRSLISGIPLRASKSSRFGIRVLVFPYRGFFIDLIDSSRLAILYIILIPPY